MNEEQIKASLLGEIKAQTALLHQIYRQLDKLNQSQAQLSPGYRRRLSEYKNFDWQSIGSIVVAHDQAGAVEVEWNGHRFDRRKGNRFDNDFIIFSQPNGQEGFYTLIKFTDYNKTPLLNIKPMEIQRTVDHIAKNGATSRPGVAQPIAGEIRQQFYALIGKLRKLEKISDTKFNELAQRGRREGYHIAMNQAKMLAGQV